MADRPRARWPDPSRRRTASALGIAAALAACDFPTFEGPQIQSPPQGFLLVPTSQPPRPLLPERTPVMHIAWVESTRDISTIYIDGFPGVLGYEEAVAAWEARRRDPPELYTGFGEVEPIRVDGRDGWGWSERVQHPTRGLLSVAYRAFVPYDTITYVIEFDSGDPVFKRVAPDTLRAVISTFGVGRTTYDVPLIALGIGLGLVAVGYVRGRAKEKAARMQSFTLPKIPQRKPEEGAAAGSPPPPAAPSAGVPPKSG